MATGACSADRRVESSGYRGSNNTITHPTVVCALFYYNRSEKVTNFKPTGLRTFVLKTFTQKPVPCQRITMKWIPPSERNKWRHTKALWSERDNLFVIPIEMVTDMVQVTVEPVSCVGVRVNLKKE